MLNKIAAGISKAKAATTIALPPECPAVAEVAAPVSSDYFLLLQVEGSAPTHDWWKPLEVILNGRSCTLHKLGGFPRCVIAIPELPDSDARPSTAQIKLALRGTEADKSRGPLDLQLAVGPARGMFSVKWATKSRIAAAKKAGGKPPWSPEDFPYSHFDGLRYLQENPKVLSDVVEGRIESGLAHYLMSKSSQADIPPISLNGSANPGNLKDLLKESQKTAGLLREKVAKLEARIQSFRKENGENATKRKVAEGKLAKALERINAFRKSNGENFSNFQAAERRAKATGDSLKELEKENELLLLQLHQVQEELEKYFLENRDLQESREKLLELAANASSASAEREAMAARVESLAAAHDDLKAQLLAVTKSSEEAASDLDRITRERDQLKLQLAKEALNLHEAAKELTVAKTTAAARSTIEAELKSRLQEEEARTKNAAKERDQFKKTADERAARIAELEAQLADQGARQKQIDEEMAKAEGQLEMLKDLLRPALS